MSAIDIRFLMEIIWDGICSLGKKREAEVHFVVMNLYKFVQICKNFLDLRSKLQDIVNLYRQVVLRPKREGKLTFVQRTRFKNLLGLKNFVFIDFLFNLTKLVFTDPCKGHLWNNLKPKI